MFFSLILIDDHPCCKMQAAVELFFKSSIREVSFSDDLFPEWMRTTLGKGNSTLRDKFKSVHILLHGQGMTPRKRSEIYEQLELTNRIQDLCEGNVTLPKSRIDWDSALGKAISELMMALYDSLDLAIFKRKGKKGSPTHQLYSEFIEKNKYVCPFCGLDKFKTRGGARREDFDHYLHKSAYPLASANMRNLVPTCGSCNQDYKKAKNILDNGIAFYPYARIPGVMVEVECKKYPVMTELTDKGSWSVRVDLVKADKKSEPKMAAWERVYSIRRRLEREIQEYFEEWMIEVADDCHYQVNEKEFVSLIKSARVKAKERAERRMEPKQIVKEAFYGFVLTRARSPFVESFRRLRNAPYI